MKNMKGVENESFDDGVNSSQIKSENDLELKEQPSDSTTTLNMENPKSEKDSDFLKPSDNFIVQWNLKARSTLNKWFFGKSQKTKLFWVVFVNGAAAGLLVATIIRFLNTEPQELDWCDGVGFLWIIYFLVYISILYSLAKKFIGKPFLKLCQPATNLFDSLTANKYFRGVCYALPILSLAAYVIIYPGKTGRRIFSFLGMVVFVLLGFLFSKYPAYVQWRQVISGMALQFAFGLLTTQFETGKNVLDCVGQKITTFLHYFEEGSKFVYGYLGKQDKDITPVFAFSVLPVIYFLSFCINILSYYGALQWFILKLSSIVRVVMGTTVCESVNAAASIFLAMTEAPLLIKNHLKFLTKSEICAVLCAGWSTVAGALMAAYIQFGVKASHLIAASFMSAPASLAYSKLIYPETRASKTTVKNIVLEKPKATNALDAASQGALSGIMIIASIIANIIAFLAFIAFLDGVLHWVGIVIGVQELSFQFLMTKLFYPISFLMGVEEESLEDVAYLVGIKTVANEFQAYQKLGQLIKANKLGERSEVIATYALCGFSNFGSIGISIAVLSAMEPNQSSTFTEVAIPAFIASNIVCFLTACVAGCLIE